MTTLDDPPADDEIEITLFGRGVGECLVLHVGHNNWVIIDSFNSEHKLPDPRSGKVRRAPVARWYLERMGIAHEHIGWIVVTHFHQDHYIGVDQLHEHYRNAQLLVTAALDDEVFRQVYSDKVEPRLCGKLPETMARARKRRSDGLRTLRVSSHILFDGARLTALAPMDGALDASAVAIAEHMTAGRRAIRAFLRDKNWCSVVLHLDTAAGYALLGGDLINEPAQYGWQAVLDDSQHQYLSRASMVKVPHHGSSNADHSGMWHQLVEDGPLMAVAPYTRLSKPIPTADDWRRLCGRGPLYQAAPSVEMVTGTFGFDAAAEGPTGVVQARRCVGDKHWRVRTEGPAFHVNPLL